MGNRRYTIKELPPELRPRERLLEAGPGALSEQELLGLLLGIGNRQKTAVELAGDVISDAGGLRGLYDLSVYELMETNGIGEAKACIIMAATTAAKPSIQPTDRSIPAAIIMNVSPKASNKIWVVKIRMP